MSIKTANITKAKHTPGPWSVTKTWPSLEFSKSYGVQAPTPEGPGFPTPAATGFYAMCCPPPHGHDAESRAIQKANAHLIAAAPDMLKLLREVLEWNEDDADLATNDTTFRLKNFADTVANRSAALRAAIAKAEG